MSKYNGITYFKFLQNRFFRWFFKKYCCKKGIHLLDECLSDEHYLYCDACGLIIYIEKIEKEMNIG